MSTACLPLEPGAICAKTYPSLESTAALSPVSQMNSPVPRPNIVRRETDQILSYYQSEHAGRPFDYASAHPDAESQHPTITSHFPLAYTHGRQYSSFSSSDCSSTYSESEDPPAVAHPVPSTSQHERERREVTVAVPVSRSSAETGLTIRSTRHHGNSAHRSRRPSVPSEGGADRRRLAIVEMDYPAPLSTGSKRIEDGKSSFDPASASSSMPVGTLFSRRGLHIGGLALVAPPDASPTTYTDLTPPSTAPITGSTAYAPPSAFPTHTRSASEAVDTSTSRTRLRHKSSRDIGIVGLSPSSSTSESLSPASPPSEEYHVYAQTEGLVPLFQTPAKSRSPTPGGTTPDLSDTSSPGAFRSPHQRLLSTPIFGMEDGIITPGIGEGKDIQQPVVGPVIVGLSADLLHGTQGTARAPATVRTSHGSPPAQSYTSPLSVPTSQYLRYQPGVHATAGPLPPPPRSIFDRSGTTAPLRPPRLHTPLPPGARRDIDAIKDALRLPQSVSAKLAARTPESQTESPGEAFFRPDSRRETRSQESTYSEQSDDEPSIRLVPAKSVSKHIREGAFPPSKILPIIPGKKAEESTPFQPQTRPVVLIEQDESDDERKEELKEAQRRPGLELYRDSSWVSLGDAANRLSSPNGKSAVLPTVSISRSPSNASEESSSSSVSRLPSLPPKSICTGSDDEKTGASLAPSAFKSLTNLKRFSSLPRTPSHSSKSSKRSTSPDRRRSISPPPVPPVLIQSPPRIRPIPTPKYIHAWPPAMNVTDIVVLRSARERARGYAMKINELSMYDCGMREWMAERTRGSVSHPRVQSQRTAHQSLHSSPAEFGGMAADTPRHVSHGSMASEMTFPIRADAYTATDLSVRTIDIAPTTAPPAILPYPSLAQAQLQRAPTRSSTLLSPTKSLQIPLPLPSTKASGTGFFASLGRKTSIRKDKGLPVPHSQSPTKVLSKQRAPVIAASQSSPSPPRPAPPPLAPSVPGGPRAAPGRIQRSKTYSVGPGTTPHNPEVSRSPPSDSTLQSTTSTNTSNSQRQSTSAGRRPSLFARARQGVVSTSNKRALTPVDPAFQRSVDKLADLLPHADRAVLAGYLRRAGEDILAIGQFLEDEKNGTLRRD